MVASHGQVPPTVASTIGNTSSVTKLPTLRNQAGLCDEAFQVKYLTAISVKQLTCSTVCNVYVKLQ